MKLVVVLVASGMTACGADSRGGDDEGGDGTHLVIRAPNAPAVLIAYRDGSGPWMTAKGADTPLTIPIASGRYTAAFVCPTPLGLSSPHVAYEMTLGELKTLDHDRACADDSVMISGQLTGGTGGNAGVAFGGIETGRAMWPGGAFMVSVPPGTHDLVAAAGSPLATERILIVRDLTVSATTSQSLDLSGPGSVATERPVVSWPGDTFSRLYTEGGTTMDLGLAIDGHMVAVPASALRPGDLVATTITSTGSVGSGPKSLTSSTHVAHARRTSFVLPTALQPPAAAASHGSSTTPHTLSVQWQAQPSATAYTLYAETWRVYLSPQAFEETATASVPDLSAVPGWQSYGLPQGSSHSWGLYALTGASLEDQIRSIHVREVVLDAAGWGGTVQVQ